MFWTYLMWAQFLVIWYGNLPEETGFVFARLWGTWLPIGRAVFLGMFLIPFIGLLGVGPKKIPGHDGALRHRLASWRSGSSGTCWCMPSVTELDGPIFGLPELGPTLLMAGLFFLAYGLFARTFPMVSPRLAEITVMAERHHAVEDHFDHDEKANDFLTDPDVS